MESNYAKYLRETGLAQIVEDELGFATFKYEDDLAYILDIYVIPEKRKEHIASHYANQIAEIAKQDGKTALIGSTNLEIKDTISSIKTLLAYGFKPWFADKNVIYYKKEII